METILTIRIDTTMQRVIERLARKNRMSKSAVVREALQRLAKEPVPAEKDSAYAAVADLMGCFHSGRGDLSARTGELFRGLLKKKRAR